MIKCLFRNASKPNGQIAVILFKNLLVLNWEQDTIQCRQLIKELPVYWDLRCGGGGGRRVILNFKYKYKCDAHGWKTVYFQVQLSTKIIITITIIMLESMLKIIYKRRVNHLKVRISVSDLTLVFSVLISSMFLWMLISGLCFQEQMSPSPLLTFWNEVIKRTK